MSKSEPQDRGAPTVKPLWSPTLRTAPGENASDVDRAIRDVIEMFSGLGPRKDIASVVLGPAGNTFKVKISERDARIIRFCLYRALESI